MKKVVFAILFLLTCPSAWADSAPNQPQSNGERIVCEAHKLFQEALSQFEAKNYQAAYENADRAKILFRSQGYDVKNVERFRDEAHLMLLLQENQQALLELDGKKVPAEIGNLLIFNSVELKRLLDNLHKNK